MSIDLNEIFTQIIAFLIMLWVMKKYGWKPLMNMLEERRRIIQNEFDDIDNRKKEVKQLAKQYSDKLENIDDEARHKIQEAVKEAQQIAKEIHREAQRDARELLDKAKSEVDRTIHEARAKLKDDVVNIGVSIAQKILEEKIDEKTHRKLIDDFVKHAELP